MAGGCSEKPEGEVDVEKKELLERLSYAMAELANMRRMFEREVSRAESAAVQRLVSKLIHFYEEFEKVVKSVEGGSSPALGEALNMLLKELEKILVSEGVEKMDVVGKEFNPFDHEAVEVFESDEVSVDTVVGVLSHGYRFRDKILKPPKVRVAKPKKPAG
ncbi:MAG: nucleotide exchange factor GrpE [Candidatus Caldarchaeum sp.]|nr:nucleotide exchange factor GrpE [Candidatus Caldarchaeum sp.]MDW8435695.1 nucleotide exchange factor GrpE [Candidatus Caldarchaeum sp.]